MFNTSEIAQHLAHSEQLKVIDRALTVIDVFTRESIAIKVGRSILAEQVVRTLELLRLERGAPRSPRCDNGPEFISRGLDAWAYAHSVKIEFSRTEDRQTAHWIFPAQHALLTGPSYVFSPVTAVKKEDTLCASNFINPSLLINLTMKRSLIYAFAAFLLLNIGYTAYHIAVTLRTPTYGGGDFY